jgi:hypothetical protein
LTDPVELAKDLRPKLILDNQRPAMHTGGEDVASY